MSASRSMKIGAIVLAAGFSNRFGSIKLCAVLPDGKTVFQHTYSNLSSALSDIMIVTRSEVAPLLPVSAGQLLNFNDAEQGMGASLAFGVQQINDWDACLVCLADMPAIRPASYQAVRDHLTPHVIVVPRYKNKIGNPCGFGRDFFPALRSLRGDRGGRMVIKDNPDAVVYVDLDDPAILLDIDTPADLAHIPLS